MDVLFQYLIKSSSVLCLFYLSYKALLANETFFTIKRGYLVLGFIVSLILPFVVITHVVEVDQIALTQNQVSNYLNTSNTNEKPQWNWSISLMSTYFIGVLFMVFRIIYQLIYIAQMISSGKSHQENGFTYIHVESNSSPFSLFNYIVFNPDLHTEEHLKIILAHEKVHCNQMHSIDMLVAQLFLIFYWFNPIAWLYQKELAQNLEYIADEQTIDNKKNIKEYQYLLLNLAIKSKKLVLINPFYNSLIKKRIFMLNKKKSPLKSFWKLLPILPLTVLFISLFNTEIIAQTSNKNAVEQNNIYVLEVNSNSSDNALDKKIALLNSKDISLEFKKVKRNNASKITDIKVLISDSHGYTSEYAVSGTKPISTFHIRTELDGNQIINSHFNSTLFTPPPPPIPNIKGLESGLSSEDRKAFAAKGNSKIVVHKQKTKVVTIDSIDAESISKIIIESIDFDDHDSNANSLLGIELKNKDLDSINLENLGDMILEFKGNLSDLDDLERNELESEPDNKIIIISDETKINPIIIIDGEEQEQGFDLDVIATDAIKSINVLKGKAAEKIVGERSSNGIIIIKTKKEKLE